MEIPHCELIVEIDEPIQISTCCLRGPEVVEPKTRRPTRSEFEFQGQKDHEKNRDTFSHPPVTHGGNINRSAFSIMKCSECVGASSCPARRDWQPSRLGTALWVSAWLKLCDGYQVARVAVRWTRARRRAAVCSPPFQPTGSWDKQSCGQRGWIRHKAP